ncbi:MAG: signal peptidase I [Alphaproteobacteria bacterium]|nr:signal peptidase I [Alphaproteobacteria bacterium]
MTKQSFLELIKSFAIALLLAVTFRSFAFEPFHIPSGSMKPNLLIGDYIFVSKYSYGYSRYSFPFGIPAFSGRFFEKKPQRGDIIVFKLPKDPSINYIKRLIGLPGDRIQVKDGLLYINGNPVKHEPLGEPFVDHDGASDLEIPQVKETLPEGNEFVTLDQDPDGALDNTGEYIVPPDHFFFMGDNRDNSQDSRVLSAVGFVPKENLVGRAVIIFFSHDFSLTGIFKWMTTGNTGRNFKRL